MSEQGGNDRSVEPADVLYLISAVTILVSFLLPWWMDDLAPSRGTSWPIVALVAGVGMLAVGMARLAHRWAFMGVLSLGPLAAFVGLVGFYSGIVKNEFSDWEFTRFVDVGFFIALIGIGWGLAAVICTQVERRQVLGCVLMALAVTVSVWLLYDWTKDNKAHLEAPSRHPIPEAS